ncbi:MAG: ABC transporter ATP-binding protein [Tannerellaceae bacterium]|jgi:ABC-2 type transport system ATP-binding protein|nr:ABC transporter ATP-binding protein [Tannerellaceae bacterium]
MITISNLTVSHQKDKPTLNRLDLSITDNAVHGLVGLNGAGKTTFFNTLFGLKKPDGGTILHNGQRLTPRQIAYLPTEHFFYSGITGPEYLELFEKNKQKAGKWLELFNLPSNLTIDEYSTGMKRKLALAGVILLDRPVMLLDEPFNGLDIESCLLLQMLLSRLKAKNKTIVVSSHVIETLTGICHAIHYLEAGRIKLSCPKSNFPALEQQISSIVTDRHIALLDNCLKQPE